MSTCFTSNCVQPKKLLFYLFVAFKIYDKWYSTKFYVIIWISTPKTTSQTNYEELILINEINSNMVEDLSLLTNVLVISILFINIKYN